MYNVVIKAKASGGISWVRYESKESFDRAFNEINGGLKCDYDLTEEGISDTRAIELVHRHKLKPGIYRHFKGNMYHVLGVSENTETKELTVVYIPQYGEHRGKLSNRSLAMFIGEVDRPELNYKGPRFKLIKEKQFISKRGK